MAEDLGDKTEAPTAKRRQEAREQGQVARSHDLTSAVLLLGFLLLMQGYGSNLIKALKGVVAFYLSSDTLNETRPSHMMQTITGSLMPVAAALAPIFLGAMLIAIVINLIQVGLHFDP